MLCVGCEGFGMERKVKEHALDLGEWCFLLLLLIIMDHSHFILNLSLKIVIPIV